MTNLRTSIDEQWVAELIAAHTLGGGIGFRELTRLLEDFAGWVRSRTEDDVKLPGRGLRADLPLVFVSQRFSATDAARSREQLRVATRESA